MLKKEEFTEKSLELYRYFNDHKLHYKDGDSYDKLVSADPFYISSQDYDQVVSNGSHLLNWLYEQNEVFKQLGKDKSLDWIHKIISNDVSPKVLDYQFAIANLNLPPASIIRSDLSSFPNGCHEAQLRWGTLGHMHFLTEGFKQIIPLEPGTEIINQNFAEAIQESIDEKCVEDNEVCILLVPDKDQQEAGELIKLLSRAEIVFVPDFEDSFYMKDGKVLLKRTDQVVRLIFRREVTLKTLLDTKLGEEVVKAYLNQQVDFEPGLNIINDTKIGMALAFDPRSRQHFSDETRSIFLPTSMYDPNLVSFNQVFGTDYKDLSELFDKTTQSKRRYIYKYGGLELDMSFGGRQVYRLDDSPNHVLKEINPTQENMPGNQQWIIQERDMTKFTSRFLKGNYDTSEVEVAKSEKSHARFMTFYKVNGPNKDNVEVLSMLANFSNNSWKVSMKTARQQEGKGSVVTSIRKKI